MLMDNAGRIVLRRELLDAVWGPEQPDRNQILDQHVGSIRHALARHPPSAARIRTVRGYSYVFDVVPEETAARTSAKPELALRRTQRYRLLSERR